jgi:hypothetical protein
VTGEMDLTKSLWSESFLLMSTNVDWQLSELLHLEQNVGSSFGCWHTVEVSYVAGVSEDHTVSIC